MSGPDDATAKQPAPVSHWRTAGVCFVLLVGLLWLGAFQPFSNLAFEALSRLLKQSVDSDVVVVEIDSRSLMEGGSWPWPRSRHAELTDWLRDAGASKIFLDIDFSAPSTQEQDKALQQSLAKLPADSVLLPVFVQPASSFSSAEVVSRPIAPLAQHATLVSVSLRPDSDGIVRRALTGLHAAEQSFLAPAVALTGAVPPDPMVIDFSIDPASIPAFSYVDVLNGVVAEGHFEGKTVYVGATALELGDAVPVPVYQSLPGVFVQALIYETLRLGALRTAPNSWMIGLLAACSLLLLLLRRMGPQVGLAIIGVSAAAVFFAAAKLWADQRLLLDPAPVSLALAVIFVGALVSSLKSTSVQALWLKAGLDRREAELRRILSAANDGILFLGAGGEIQDANPTAERILGRPAEQLTGTGVEQWIPGFELPVGAERDAEAKEHEIQQVRGQAVSVEVSIWHLEGASADWLVVVRDVSERKRQQQLLIRQATHDPLTQLPNRKFLFDRLRASISNGEPAALLLLDLDRFKQVNDTYGHTTGDFVLLAISKKLRKAAPQDITIARLGGDEFAIWVQGRRNRTSLTKLARTIMKVIEQPLEIDGLAIVLGGSIGVAEYSGRPHRPEELLRRADIAMYDAKRSGTGLEFYASKKDRNSGKSIVLAHDLKKALEDDGLALVYQPKIELSSGRCCGVEALARWRHERLGDIAPQDIVEVAEANRLILHLTEWTLDRIERDTKRWQQAGMHLEVAFNVSTRALQDARFLTLLGNHLRRCTTEDAVLQAEVTETAVMSDPDATLRVLTAIRGHGVDIAIDDFGTGYSSLAYLRDIQAAVLKIDKSFIAGVDQERGKQVIVRSTIRMAQELGLQVVAEGVETRAEHDFVTKLRCDFAQGYYYGYPMDVDGVMAFLRKKVSAPKLLQARVS